mgnify:FL=1
MNIIKPILLASLLTPGFCLAEASNFNYVEIDYLQQKIDILGGDVDFNGFELSGSYEVNDEVFVSARYADVSLDEDVPGLKADVDGYALGVGYIFGSNSTATVFGELSYVDQSAKASDGLTGTSAKADADGISAGFGVRMNTSERTELNFGLSYVDFDEGGASLGYVEFVFEFVEDFSGTLNFASSEGDTSAGFGVRYSY